jgi:hypothetical protein
MRDEYHMKPKCFKFKNTGTAPGYDEVTFLYDLEVFRLIIKEIKNTNV